MFKKAHRILGIMAIDALRYLLGRHRTVAGEVIGLGLLHRRVGGLHQEALLHPDVQDLPKLTDLTLLTGSPIPGTGGTGGSSVF